MKHNSRKNENNLHVLKNEEATSIQSEEATPIQSEEATSTKSEEATSTKSEDTPSKAPKPDRKDHVLQARVSESLYKDLVTQARRLRVPVSNLVRNILEDSLSLVENIVDGGLDIAEAISGKADREAIASVLGWQKMTINRRLACAQCDRPISKGSEAFASIGAPNGRTIIICEECKCAL